MHECLWGKPDVCGGSVIVTDGWPGVLLFLLDVLFTVLSSLSLFLFINLYQLVYKSADLSLQSTLLFTGVVVTGIIYLHPPYPHCFSTRPLICQRSLSVSCFSIPPPHLVCQEKRRLQEEQDRVRREMEEEKLRLQQLKVWHTHTGCLIHPCSNSDTQTCFISIKPNTLCRPILTC